MSTWVEAYRRSLALFARCQCSDRCKSRLLPYLTGEVGQEVKSCIQVFSGQLGCEVVELNIQQDHIHLISNVPPKVSISKFMGTLKGRTAIRVFSKFPYLKDKPYWGNHFWAPGYCVDTVGLDAEMIRKYVKYQETKERREEQLQFKF